MANRHLTVFALLGSVAFAGVVLEAADTPPTDLKLVNGHWTAWDPPLPPEGTPIEFRNTHMFDVLGLPAISVPCGFTRDDLPIGLQIAGPRFGEARVLALAHAYQRITDWHRRLPPLT